MLLIAFGVVVCALGEANLVMKGLVQQLIALLFEVGGRAGGWLGPLRLAPLPCSALLVGLALRRLWRCAVPSFGMLCGSMPHAPRPGRELAALPRAAKSKRR